MRHTYPLLLDVTDRPVIIIGGGAVAARKCAGLIEAGARRVRVIAPQMHPQMHPQAEQVVARFDPTHLDGAQLVFAATDLPEVNEQIVAECRRRGIWVNRVDADDEQPGDFSTPARWSDGPLLVTVSAGGNPALAAMIRDWIGANLPRGLLAMARAMEQIRPMVLGSALPIEQRRSVFRDLATEQGVQVLEEQGMEGLLDWVKMRHPGLQS